MDKALALSINLDCLAAHRDDQVKPTCAPVDTLGREIVEKLPSVDGDILVISDVGLLFCVLWRLQSEGRDFSRVTFVAHTAAQESFAQDLSVKTWHVGYNDPIAQLEKLCMGLKFDIIVGNPPYQDASEKSHSNSLWVKFIGLARDTILPNGFMSFVVPATWAGGDRNRRVRGRQITVSSLRSQIFSDGGFTHISLGEVVSRFFDVSVEFSWFIWQQGQSNITSVSTAAGTVQTDVDALPWIPLTCSQEHLSVLGKTLWSDLPKLNMLTALNANGDIRNPNISMNSGKFELYNTSAKWKKQERVFSSIDCPHRFTKKVIFSDSGYASPMYDDGKLGLCHHGKAFAVQNVAEGEALISYLSSKLVKFFVSTKAGSGLAVDFAVVANYLPIVPLSQTWSDDALYEHFGLTQGEVDLIERTVK